MKRITCKECRFWEPVKGREKWGECRVDSPKEDNKWPLASQDKGCGRAEPLKTYNEMETKDIGDAIKAVGPVVVEATTKIIKKQLGKERL